MGILPDSWNFYHRLFHRKVCSPNQKKTSASIVKTIQDRVSIENRLATLEVKVTEIMENHLPSIERKVDKITWLLITNLTALIFLLLSKYL